MDTKKIDNKITALFFKIITDGHDEGEVQLEVKDDIFTVKTRKNKNREWIERNVYTRSAINYIAANVLLSEVLLEQEDVF
jgi:hypothetical protein